MQSPEVSPGDGSFADDSCMMTHSCRLRPGPTKNSHREGRLHMEDPWSPRAYSLMACPEIDPHPPGLNKRTESKDTKTSGVQTRSSKTILCTGASCTGTITIWQPGLSMRSFGTSCPREAGSLHRCGPSSGRSAGKITLATIDCPTWQKWSWHNWRTFTKKHVSPNPSWTRLANRHPSARRAPRMLLASLLAQIPEPRKVKVGLHWRRTGELNWVYASAVDLVCGPLRANGFVLLLLVLPPDRDLA